MGHTHETKPPRASERTSTVLSAIVGLVIALTAVGAAAVWPQDYSFFGSLTTTAEDTEWVVAVVTEGPFEGESGPEYSAEIVGGQGQGTFTILPTGDPGYAVEVGDRIRALAFPDGTLVFADFERSSPILILLIVYIVLVIAVAWWRGAGALLGLAIAFGIVMYFTVPALFNGGNPLVVALVTGAGALFVLLYLAHGVNARTTTAYLGTLAGLAVTTLLGAWAVETSKLRGLWLDSGSHFELLERGVSLPGLVLSGIILAGLGILNDVTVAQASSVWELRAARPEISRKDLFWRAMRIGRDHIASTVYTIAFAYVGAALPAIMILSLFDQGLGVTLTSADIAEEVVRTLVGSIGLVLAVPLTTGIAAAVVGKDAIAAESPPPPPPLPPPPAPVA